MFLSKLCEMSFPILVKLQAANIKANLTLPHEYKEIK